MGGDEIDAGPRPPTAMVEEVARGAEPCRQRRGRRRAFPEVAHGIAELVVPFGPARREGADLVAARTQIPRLGDQLHRAEDGILAARLEEAALIVEAVGLTRQDGAEIEAEAVDM